MPDNSFPLRERLLKALDVIRSRERWTFGNLQDENGRMCFLGAYYVANSMSQADPNADKYPLLNADPGIRALAEVITDRQHTIHVSPSTAVFHINDRYADGRCITQRTAANHSAVIKKFEQLINKVNA
jgi:hypothetical protein